MNTWKFITLLALTLLNLGILIYQAFPSGARSRIGVVQMEKLVYEFEGMKEATNTYTNQLMAWQSQMDTLENRLEDLATAIRQDSVNGKWQERKEKVNQFYAIQKSYQEFNEKISSQAAQDDQKMTQGVLNQIKTYMRQYAELEGYDLILANAQPENVPYVQETQDITDELLDFANKLYKNGQ